MRRLSELRHGHRRGVGQPADAFCYIYVVSPDDEKERPTQPDLAVFDCPECQDSSGDPQGEIIQRTFHGSGYRIRTVRCPTCLGSKTLDREGMARWQQKQRDVR